MSFNMFDLSELENSSVNAVEELSARDIAIIGIAVNFPKAENAEVFWENIKKGMDCTSDMPYERKIEADQYLRIIGLDPESVKYQKIGYLNEIDKFDYRFFKLSPKEASLMDPNQRIFLETAWSAIEDAGYGGSRLAGSATGVYVGFSANELYDYKRLIAEVEPSSAPIATPGNIIPIIASRIAYLLDLNGPSMTVDTACSSSLVAVHLACQGIRSGDCEMAVAGGIKISLLPIEKEEKLGIESSDGKTRTFDNKADGTVISEGSAAVLLKPLNKAILDHDNIYAVIKGSAINQDGSSAGITAPNAMAQANAIVKAWKDANIDPETISYIEAHGTGTRLGDPIEIDGIQKAFSRYTRKKQFCAIGSVKSNLGHLDCVAGLAGLIKSALALQHREIPPSIHFRRPNQKIKMHKTAVYVNDKLAKWESGSLPRRCGVSAFGLSGTNCHVVLEESPVLSDSSERQDAQYEILALSAKTKRALIALIRKYKQFIIKNPSLNIRDAAYTANTGREHHDYRVALIIKDIEDLGRKLEVLLRENLEELHAEGIFYGRSQHESVSIDSGEALENQGELKINAFLQGGKRSLGILQDICSLYIQGAEIKWDLLYTHEKRNRVRLPAYAFERHRCWLDLDSYIASSKAVKAEKIFYQTRWRQSSLSAGSSDRCSGAVLILRDRRGIADKLADKIRSSGRQVLLIEIGSKSKKISQNRYVLTGSEDEYAAVLAENKGLDISQIIHLASIGDGNTASTLNGLEDNTNRGVNSLFRLTRALHRMGIKSRVDVILVSEYANAVTEEQGRVQPENAALFGLGKVVGMENPLLRCRCIDIDENTDCENILQEINAEYREYISAYRGGIRYTEEISELDIPDAGNHGLPIKEGGVYLISGGTGEIGLEIGKNLAEKAKVTLILVNRSKMPDRAEWKKIIEARQNQQMIKKIKAIMAIEEKGTKVICHRANISREEDVRSLIEELKQRFGCINGIINSAGIGINKESVTLDGDSEETFRAVMAPKIQGTWLLDKATGDMKLDFFVVFSSVITLIGGAGVGAYTADNSYLDSFTGYRNKKGKRTLTLNWSMWENTFEKYISVIQDKQEIAKYKNRQMFKILSKKAGIKAFNAALNSGIERAIVGEINETSDIFFLEQQLPFKLSEELKESLEKKRNAAGQEQEGQADKLASDLIIQGRQDHHYTEEEKIIAQVWAEVLGYHEINIYDNFYELGGDSISIMKVTAKIKDRMGMDISFMDFVEKGTIAELADSVAKRNPEGEEGLKRTAYPKILPDAANVNKPFEVTDVQMAYLLGQGHQFDIGGVSTHAYAEIETKFDMKELNRSLQKVIDRHAMLRAIVLPNGTQQILEEVPEYVIDIMDLQHLDQSEQEACILKERNRMSHHVFKSDQWPLFEFKAFRLSEDIHYLFVGFDMLITDGACLEIIARELMEFYNNPGLEMPKLEFTFRDYMEGYKQLKKSDLYKLDKEYWMKKLPDFPAPPDLPLKTNPSNVTKPHFNRCSKFFEKKEWDQLKRKAQKINVTPSVVLCTIYAEVLSYWSNQRRLAIDLPIYNRYPFHPDADNIIGDFTSIILLDIDLEQDTEFWARARNVQSTLFQALEHRHYEGTELIRAFAKQNNTGTKAAMPIVFTSMIFNDERAVAAPPGELIMKITQTPQVYIDNHAYESTEGNLEINWHYVEELFDEDVIQGMFEDFVEKLSHLMRSDEEYTYRPNQKDLELIEKYNQSESDIPVTTLNRLFTEQAARTPDHKAVSYENEHLTYRELNEKSNQVAHYLKEQGIGCNEFVAVIAKRRIETIANIMGILKAGAAYIPVDPDYPEDRREYILSNSHCRITLDPQSYQQEGMEKFSRENTGEDNDPENIAYVLYTSGSTGRPKGVIITHTAAANTILAINRRFNTGAGDKVIGISSMCFDLSVYDIFGTLSSGATLVLIPNQRDIRSIMDVVHKERITIWNSVPAIMDMCLENVDECYVNHDLRYVIFSGDWIPVSLPEKVKKHFKNTEVIGSGGPTETSIWCVYYPIGEVRPEWKSIPYGMALDNHKIYILNDQRELCPVGVPGEMYIGGRGLGKGYLNDEERTKEAFIEHPALGRLYKSGDYGILHKEGYMEILGRKDQQVKIKGYRIELGEIESSLIKHPSVKSAVVIDRTDKQGKRYLCAYLTADEDITVKELRTHLAAKLPDYMVPSSFVLLDKLPLTPNGKVDRRGLPEPDGEVSMGVEYVEPVNETEESLVSIWKKLLEVEKVGTNDNFFDLGGDSFSLVRMHNLIQQEYPGKINITDIFTNPTISMLTKFITGSQEIKKVHHEEIDEDQYLSELIDIVRGGGISIDEAIASLKAGR